jgi:endogenous inhibitor of DNA gyrase (YacG/DUF329 family)
VTASSEERLVPCPACGAPALFGAQNAFRPFCSKRCRLTDLGAWATESYRIAVREEDDGGKPEDTGA